MAASAQANVQPASPFSNNAVLQRDKPILIWGTADPGEKISVSYAGTESRNGTATADTTGKWSVTLDALPASDQPATLTFQGNNQIILKNILVGDVWLAAGQSNMDMALFWTERGKQLAKDANSPNIRYFKVGTTAAASPQPRLNGGWSVAVAPNASGFTEVGYNFALELQSKLKIPIGIVNSSWGGTSVESWMSAAALKADPASVGVYSRWDQTLAELPAKQARYEELKSQWEAEKAATTAAGTPFSKQAPFPPSGAVSQYLPSSLYNAMVHPLLPLRVRGIIWYQGENNTRRPEEYRTLFPSLIRDWRSQLGQGDLPFYWVQLPGYNIGSDAADWPGLREAQSMAQILPNTGQAVTIDIGDPKEIHPANKKEVGRRLSLLALRRNYGFKDIVDSGPSFEKAQFLPDGTVRLSFTGLADGLKVNEGEIGGFELTADGKTFVKAKAQLEPATNTILLSAPGLNAPTGVRYAWSNNPLGLNLANSAGLPLAPFRTAKP